LINCQLSYPDSLFILAGDFNLVMSNTDAVNRGSSQAELQVRTFLKRNLDRLDLIDAHRIKHQIGGFTWKRGLCMSRLDMVFMTKDLSSKILNTEIDWTFDDSDHGALSVTLAAPDTLERGLGLTTVDSSVLDDCYMLEFVKR